LIYRWILGIVLIVLFFPFVRDFIQSAEKTTPIEKVAVTEDFTEEQALRLIERSTDIFSVFTEKFPTIQEAQIALISKMEDLEIAQNERISNQVSLLNNKVENVLNFIDQKDFIRAKISAMEIKWVPGIFGGDLNKEMTEHYNNIREELLKLVPEE